MFRIIRNIAIIIGLCCSIATAQSPPNIGGMVPSAPILNTGTINQIPVYPGSNGTVVPTGVSAWFDAVCSSTIGQLWVRLTAGWGCTSLGFVNPRWWGAVGDGSTLDLNAFNTMLSAASSAGIGLMLLPSTGSNFYCVSGLNVTQPLRIVGEGNNVSNAALATCSVNTGKMGGITINSFGNTVENIQVSGAQIVSNSSASITAASPAVVTDVTSPQTEFAANQQVIFTAGTLPIGLSLNTLYYIISPGLTSTSFEISATQGGAAINTSGSAGSGITAVYIPSFPALSLACVECQGINLRTTGGSNTIQVSNGDTFMIGGHHESSYGVGIINLNGYGSYMLRMKRDQNYPTGSTCGAVVNWSAGLSVAVNDCLLLPSNFYMQVTAVSGAHTTGSSAPAPAAYNTAISDGALVTEKLLAPKTYYAVYAPNNIGWDAFSDNTGPYTYGMYLGSSQVNYISYGTFGNELKGAILASGTQAAIINGNQMSACAPGTGNGCDGIDVIVSGAGSIDLIGNLMFSNPNGNNVFIQNGGTFNIVDNMLFGTTNTGAFIGTAVTGNVNFSNNQCNSPTWGAPTNGITLQAGFAGNIKIIGNAGCTINDASTDVNQTVLGNN